MGAIDHHSGKEHDMDRFRLVSRESIVLIRTCFAHKNRLFSGAPQGVRVAKGLFEKRKQLAIGN
jgi:hypothetical protein